ncbi:MAG: hypothetical protein U0Y10_05615 [Spirosomataceae bacterium]
MIQTFTQNDIVRYVYDETTDEENQLIEEALIEDTDLLMFYLDIADLKEGMDKVRMQPSDRSVDKILAFSRNFSENQSTSISV